MRRRAPPPSPASSKQGNLRPRQRWHHLFRRDDTIDSVAHELVALACRRFEPRPVNLDRAPPIGPDRTRRAELAIRHASPSFAARQAIPKASPASAAGRHRRPDRGRAATTAPGGPSTECSALQAATCWNCSQQRPGEGLNRSPQGAAAAERRLKSRRRNLQRGPCHPHHRGHRRARRPERRQDAHGSFIADDRGRDRLSVRHIHDEGDQAAKGEIDPFDIGSPDRTSTASRSSVNQSEMTAQANRGLLAATQLTVDYQPWSCAPSREYSFPDGGAARSCMARQTACS